MRKQRQFINDLTLTSLANNYRKQDHGESARRDHFRSRKFVWNIRSAFELAAHLSKLKDLSEARGSVFDDDNAVVITGS